MKVVRLRWMAPMALLIRVALGAMIGGGIGYAVGTAAGDVDLWLTIGLVVGCANAGAYNPDAVRLGPRSRRIK